MKQTAQRYNEFYKHTSKGTRILFALLYDIPNNLHRFFVSESRSNAGGMIAAIGIGIFGGWLTAIIDIVTILKEDRIYWFDEYYESEKYEHSAPAKKPAAMRQAAASVEAGEDVMPEMYSDNVGSPQAQGYIKLEGTSKLGGDTYEGTAYQPETDKGKYEK